MPKLSLVMPMYNEEEIIEHVLKETADGLTKAGINYELITVNNGSEDKTGEILNTLAKNNPKIKPLHIPINEGCGSGIITGLKHANGDIVGFIDGDAQVPIEDIIKVYKTFEDPTVMFAKGIRYRRGDGLKRNLASFMYNGLFKILFPSAMFIRDVNGKPKFFRREFYNTLNIESKRWAFDAEIIIKALKRKQKPKEVLVRFEKRRRGKSKVSSETVKDLARELLRWRIRAWKKKM